MTGEAPRMRLYVCWGTFAHPFGHVHPCNHAWASLRAAGHDPQVIKCWGLHQLPDALFNRSIGRREARRLTGRSMVPVLVTADGQVTGGSERIADWATHNHGSFAPVRGGSVPGTQAERRPGLL